MSVKTMLKPASLLPWVFHIFFKPVFGLLPQRRRNELMTIAHHIKLTLFYGHVMEFSNAKTGPRAIGSEVLTGVAAVPPWVAEEMRQLAEIEPELYPAPEYLKQFHAYRLPMNDAPGKVFAACRRLIGLADPDIIFIVPELQREGADLAALHHINVCKKIGARVVLITTLDTVSPRLGQVAQNTPTVELGHMGRWLTEAEKRIVLVRLVLQSGASTIHVIQSQLGWEMLKFHGKSLLAEEKSVFVSLYADDSDSAGQNYARYYLASTLPYLSGIICDSAYYPKELRRRYGVGSDQIFTAYFPATGIGKQKYFSSEKGKVLWASRITQRKRPDLLLKIAKAMPDVNFHVRGHAETREEKQIAKKISKLSNVTFTGSYDFGGLVEEGDEFSLFLYTSATDGMPNVLLEATVAGLPIVASAVGGVPELINEETGYPVDKNAPPEVYISTIRRALENPGERQERWNKARDLVQKRHTHERFFQQMIGVNGYFPITHIEDSPKVSALA